MEYEYEHTPSHLEVPYPALSKQRGGECFLDGGGEHRLCYWVLAACATELAVVLIFRSMNGHVCMRAAAAVPGPAGVVLLLSLWFLACYFPFFHCAFLGSTRQTMYFKKVVRVVKNKKTCTRHCTRSKDDERTES